MMSKLSAHCVRQIIPSLMEALLDRQWRTKAGSIEVMASMSHLAPQQLSNSLPTIVPKITEALSDTHQKVQESAKHALVSFGSVIKNPEIQQLVPILIQALIDPNTKTVHAINALLDTTFIHYIDSPSLALLVPIIHRGITERSAEIKKKASHLIGNMASLTEQRDLAPYLPLLVPSLKLVLIDPVPETRATAARSFGTMVQKMGEGQFPNLINELLEILSIDISNVDKSGAAQGISEIVAGLGLDRLESLLPGVIAKTHSVHAYIREGFMILLIYLPTTFGASFTPYITKIVQPILMGLADDEELVREASLKSGRVVVRNYAKSAINLLLPELELGLFNENWRIRQQSMLLVGELLFQLSGISTKLQDDVEVDEGLATEAQRQAIREALGVERFHAVLARIYIIRGDPSALVRQTSIQVWKSIVMNTPKTLKDILPVLMTFLISSLASPSVEKRGIAARTFGDLVQRLDSILHDVVPILSEGINSKEVSTRQGACVGMYEILVSASNSGEVDFVSDCTSLVKLALVDSDPQVRESAAQSFDILHQTLGSRAIDDILPALLLNLKSDANAFALEGLKEIMALRSSVVFPVLIPTLLASPMTGFNAQALGSLISVAGEALNKRLPLILPTLIRELETSENAGEILYALETLLCSVEGVEGVHVIMRILDEIITEAKVEHRLIALRSLVMFFKNTEESFDEYVADWIKKLIRLLAEEKHDIAKTSWDALDTLIKRLPKNDLGSFVPAVRRGISEATARLELNSEVFGFNLTKGLAPLLSVLLQGLMTGDQRCREDASIGLSEAISRTNEISLKPFVTQITGPLIRVVGDRFPNNVKTAILETVGLLLVKVPLMLKPFLPQLQRTFCKSLSDPQGTPKLRRQAAHCLSLLIKLQPRLDPLVVELIQGLKSREDLPIIVSVWEALLGLLKGIDKDRQISSGSVLSIQLVIMDVMIQSGENDSALRVIGSKCFGAFIKYLPEADGKTLLR